MRALALCSLLPTLALAAPGAVVAPSRVDKVTVFRTGARVTRTSSVELPPGRARILVDGLPDALDDDSIRVEGRGRAKGRIFGVTVDRVTGEDAASAEARTAEERVERLEDEERAIDDRVKAVQARLQLVGSLRSTYSEERTKNLAVRSVSVREWGEVAAYVGRETADATHELRKSEVARRDLGRRIAQARADLAKVQAKRERTTKAVAIEVESEQGGAFDVALSYAVGAAGWQPVWDARLLTESSTMELSLEGSVWQRTGEDWNGVALTVSTAQPCRGLFVPKLDPHYLTRHEPPRAGQFGAAEDKAAAPPAAAQGGHSRSREKALEPEESEEPEEQMELASAGVEEGLLSASFTAPRRETVDGSGQARKVPLAHFPLRAEIARSAAPRLEAATFLTAKAVNATGFPLLGGAASVYVGNEFAGRTTLTKTPPGGELELAFGVDDRVEVDRKVLERRHESAGTFTKDEIYRYRVRISVKNRYASPVTVKLVDLIPVSRDEKIAVRILDGSTAATREDPERPGVRAYELALAAGEQKTVELRYEVRYPRELPIAGLE